MKVIFKNGCFYAPSHEGEKGLRFYFEKEEFGLDALKGSYSRNLLRITIRPKVVLFFWIDRLLDKELIWNILKE
jgi:hypothetical protein